MNPIRSSMTIAALALAGLGSAAPMHASAQPVYVAPPVYQVVPGPRGYAYGYDGDRDDYPRWHRACRAPVWDPNVRYMPGQAVWREGKLYVATSVSASVWNVNSPPEWTPDYWVPARCR